VDGHDHRWWLRRDQGLRSWLASARRRDRVRLHSNREDNLAVALERQLLWRGGQGASDAEGGCLNVFIRQRMERVRLKETRQGAVMARETRLDARISGPRHPTADISVEDREGRPGLLSRLLKRGNGRSQRGWMTIMGKQRFGRSAPIVRLAPGHH